MARVVDLPGAGGGAVAPVVLPREAAFGEDADGSAAGAACGDGIFLGPVISGGG